MDGDTIKVRRGEDVVVVRLIGVDTPETVDPRKEVQAYGKEASAFLTNLLKGEDVWLRRDPANLVGKYHRELAYIYRAPDGLNVNLEIIRQGYGHAYVAAPHPDMEAYRVAETRARILEKGMWAPDAGGEKKEGAAAPSQPRGLLGRDDPPPAPTTDPTVYVTRTGEKYHRAGCRYLSRSCIPIELSEARSRYSPCSVSSQPL